MSEEMILKESRKMTNKQMKELRRLTRSVKYEPKTYLFKKAVKRHELLIEENEEEEGGLPVVTFN
jgi:hypothetical protein